jgi:hypothetical protein
VFERRRSSQASIHLLCLGGQFQSTSEKRPPLVAIE